MAERVVINNRERLLLKSPILKRIDHKRTGNMERAHRVCSAKQFLSPHSHGLHSPLKLYAGSREHEKGSKGTRSCDLYHPPSKPGASIGRSIRPGLSSAITHLYLAGEEITQTCASFGRMLRSHPRDPAGSTWLARRRAAGGLGRAHNHLLSGWPRSSPGTIHLCKPP